MSKKRTSAESNNDEQTNEGSESQKENYAKRAKLDTLSDTTIHDLPIELLQCILVKAVAMEVKGMKLVKSVRKEKAELVISRLTTVCSQWNSILTTNFFRNELHRILDSTAEDTIRLEVLHEFEINPASSLVTTMGDEIFLLLKKEHVINVYNRDTINSRNKAKDVIKLPRNKELVYMFMAACRVSNCVYVCVRTKNYSDFSVVRITKEKEHQFNISPWIKDHRRPISVMSVSANGSLIILSLHYDAVSIYDANGSLQHEIMLSPDIDVEADLSIMQKSNGNIVLAYINDQDYGTTLLELDTSGSKVRRYKSPFIEFRFSEESSVNFADIHGRFLITTLFQGFELLDSEFNSLGIYSLQQDNGKDLDLCDLHYESERNEFVRIHYDRNTKATVLTIFRVTED